MFIKNRRLFARILLCSLISTTFNAQAFNWSSLYNSAVNGLRNIRYRATNIARNVRNGVASLRNWPRSQFNRLEQHIEQRVNNRVDNISNHVKNHVNQIGNNAQNKVDSIIWNGIFGITALATTFCLIKYLWNFFNK